MTDESVVNEQVLEDPNATPAAVEHAEATGVDLSSVEGSGAEGRILKADVVEASEQAAVEDPASIARNEAASKVPPTGRAADSGDPVVHQLMGERYTLEQNLAALLADDEDQIASLRDRIAAVDKQLADLGYTV